MGLLPGVTGRHLLRARQGWSRLLGGRALAGRAWLRRLGGRRAGHPTRYGHSQRERSPQPRVPGVTWNLTLQSFGDDRVITRFACGDRVMESMETLGRQVRAYHPMS